MSRKEKALAENKSFSAKDLPCRVRKHQGFARIFLRTRGKIAYGEEEGINAKPSRRAHEMEINVKLIFDS
jgi:hypothetical protein